MSGGESDAVSYYILNWEKGMCYDLLELDENRPQCRRCQKANIQCDGFQGPVIFINETARVRKKVSRGAAEQSPAVESLVEENDSILVVAPKSGPPSEVLSMGMSQALDLSGFTENIFHSFMLTNLFSGGVFSGDHSGNAAWITACLDQSEVMPTSSVAISCLATTLFGRKHGHRGITDKGTVMYGQALRNLSADLQNPAKA